ncbi:restriction endonuclease subunit S [uncultured Gilvimarinus sp.]|uniref:restriction endonuclease subunit S n=1 Tax=uncultured Gilvimarinus sp. TaxID=1689143 RepID=UPI0030ED0AFA
MEWFGLVPCNWQSSRLKFEAEINMGQSPSSDDCNQDGVGLPFLQGNAEFGDKTPSPKQYCDVPRKIANKGDHLFSVRAPVGALNIADQSYGIGRGLCAITSNVTLNSKFLWWLIPVVKTELDAVSTGSTFEAVSAEQVENVVVYIPSISEQTQIANFLDRETAKIDALIEKQQRLIALLKEKRQAVISHAVTKGLSCNGESDVPMKDSGVEWLGEVPAHWEVKKLKYFCQNIIAGPFGSSITKDMYCAQGYKVYGQEQVIPNDFLKGDYYISAKSFSDLMRYRVEAGDLLISCVGTFGKIAVFPENAEKGIINPRLIKAKLLRGYFPLYIREFLKSDTTFKQFELLSRGGTMGVINIGILNEIDVAAPPYDEQIKIYDRIASVKDRYSALIGKAVTQIELLQERRTALISAAVTGKIDVRDHAPAADDLPLEA